MLPGRNAIRVWGRQLGPVHHSKRRPTGPSSANLPRRNDRGLGHHVQSIRRGFHFYDCQTKPACPERMSVDPNSGMCVLNPLQLQVTPEQLLNLTVPPARPPSSGPSPAGDERAPDGRCAKIIPGAVLPSCSAGYTMSPDGKVCVRAAGTPVGPAPIGPVGIPAGRTPIAPVETPTTATPAAKAPGETTSLCPAGESQVPGAKPGTCKSCPSGTHPNADGACVRTTITRHANATPATAKTTSPTTKLTTPTRTISKPPKLLVTHPKPTPSPKRPPKKLRWRRRQRRRAERSHHLTGATFAERVCCRTRLAAVAVFCSSVACPDFHRATGVELGWTSLGSWTHRRRLGDCKLTHFANRSNISSLTIRGLAIQDYGTKTIKAAAFAAALGALVVLGCGIANLEPASAQAPGILTTGNAVVTGFSGAPLPAQLPPGVNPADLTFIDLNGPSARVVDLQAPGAPPQAQLITAPLPFTVTAAQVGQVFAVALDGATPPNIYVAATSAYGLPIVMPGQRRRAHAGVSGRAGRELHGGLVRTGGARRRAGIDLAHRRRDRRGQPVRQCHARRRRQFGPGLGGLAFDAASNTLIVADRDTGMIHRFALTGAEVGRYDHGVQGLTAAGLPPVALRSEQAPRHHQPEFQHPGPLDLVLRAAGATGLRPRGPWRPALLRGRRRPADLVGRDRARRLVWGRCARGDSGSAGNGSSEISKITFDNPGRMLLAQRAAPTGAADFVMLAAQSAGLLLRYQLSPPTNAPAPPAIPVAQPGRPQPRDPGRAAGESSRTAGGAGPRRIRHRFLRHLAQQHRRDCDRIRL